MTDEQTRPADVDTGFWLWAAALPLLAIGYVVDLIIYGIIYYLVVISRFRGNVATFLILMRHGYRWARTFLTGGAVASVVYTGTNLFTVPRPTAAAVTYAITAIVGSVLIVGGVFLLHRKDAHAFFTR